MPTNKTFTNILFFKRTSETIKAFEETQFTGSSSTPPYPNQSFNNTIGTFPFISLGELNAKFGCHFLFNLGGTGTVSGTTVNGTGDMFADVIANSYLLYRIAGTGNGTTDGLKVLGIIDTKVSDNQVILKNLPPSETIGEDLDVFGWDNVNQDQVTALNFDFSSSFYMLVKNVDYVTSSGKHDSVLFIDTSRTSTNFNSSPATFAYSSERRINPNFFSLKRISKIGNPESLEISETDIPCTIKGVSKWSEKSSFENLEILPSGEIPYWSAYLIDPYGTSAENLDKNTFYRLTIPDVLPASQIVVSGTGGEE